MSVLGLIMSFPPYLRSAMVRFPLTIYLFEFIKEYAFCNYKTNGIQTAFAFILSELICKNYTRRPGCAGPIWVISPGVENDS